tara:strand:- start:2684 stop:2866 length:183 start_codon:yes stop_codon:yes gene_type:complete
LKITKTPKKMKKLLTSLMAVSFILLIISSCGSAKGCGLTSDASEIQNNIATDQVLVAEAK